MSFKPDFVWGAATSAYQIEGARDADGRGPSIWEVFEESGGRIWNEDRAATACDHYNRYPDDIALMRQIGIRAYRMSISWPRVLPSGTGGTNGKGLGFYDRLVDELLRAGIEPWITLFHWDYPYALHLRGGWLNADSSKWFADYVGAVVDHLSDRVSKWLTFNEPQIFLGFGLGEGTHAPGARLGWPELLRAHHHVLLAHGLAVQTIRAKAQRRPVVGTAMVANAMVPASPGSADVEAARAAMFSPGQPTLWDVALHADPIMLGHYPAHTGPVYGRSAPRATAADMATIHQPLDFYGLNIYDGQPIRADRQCRPERVREEPGGPRTSVSWPVRPEAIYWASKFLHDRYKKPILISENGMANPDWVALDGEVRDPQRMDFLTRYLAELRRAAREGVDVMGYFYWSLIDNFEWAEGYKHRFGLVYVDYASQRRILKESARCYRRIIETNGDELPESGRF